MIRADIISNVGREYLTSNIENDEFSYPKALSLLKLEHSNCLIKNCQKMFIIMTLFSY